MPLPLALLLIAFPVGVFVPGFVALRGFRLPDEARLPLSIAVSVAFLYLASFALYLVDAGPAAAVAIGAAIAALALVHRGELVAFLRAPAVRALLLHYAIFAIWLVLLSLLVRGFSGAGWMGDWQEHYERALLFLGRLPLETRFLGLWALPARPPLDNLVAAFFMRLAGDGFAAYQLASVLLGSLEYLGAASLWLALTRGRRAGAFAGLLVLTALLALNPSVVHNATYTWTRALTNFFLLQAAALYLVGLREGAPAARRWSFLLLGLALATHYSTAPYLVALAAVEVRLLWTRRLAPREAALGALLVAAPVAPWLAFALHRFGLAGTFLTNSTVEWNAALEPAGVALRALGNLWRTLVPHVFREVPPLWAQEYAPALARDYAFLVYQVSLPALMGSLGGLAVAWLLATGARRRLRAGVPEVPALVLAFLAMAVVLGTATVADDDAYGVAHVCLQPLGIAGLAYLASRWTSAPAWLRAGTGVGLAADAALGIGLHFWVQHLTLEDLVALNPDHPVVSGAIVATLQAKEGMGLAFLADLPGRPFALGIAAAAALALLARAGVRAAAEARPAAAEVRPAAGAG
jgi:hypothetical protein